MGEFVMPRCELCKEEAFVYCSSDSAFLCRDCDEKIHCANFLVARHVRVRVCPRCRTIPLSRNMKTTLCCQSCSVQKEDTEIEDVSVSSYSSCVSSTGEEREVTSSSSRRRSNERRNIGGRAMVKPVVDKKVEGILVNWCRMMGMEDTRVVDMTVQLLTTHDGEMTILPFRVSLASAFWVAIRLCCGVNELPSVTALQYLRRLEQISGVPAKLITQSQLTRVIKRRQSRLDYEEGWAEC